jgi:hypothetical protein
MGGFMKSLVIFSTLSTYTKPKHLEKIYNKDSTKNYIIGYTKT